MTSYARSANRPAKLVLTPRYPRPEQEYLAIIKAGGKISGDAATKLFDQLKPIEPSFLMGEWEGGDLDIGHPITQELKRINWAGKTFRTEEDVDPVVVRGTGGERTFMELHGRARVREVKFRGVVSAAMVYDDKPIIDHFRFVSEDIVAGIMDTKIAPPGYHFYLTRYRIELVKSKL
ncbi:FAD binding domain-containing protein [Mycena sanguinolenta]|uniref:FAD binding domain-containing protein n=1 Tax=Mycena sanguinolenta TaxID=230812 RepID=A0A8H6XUC4_9AGAR|nr:FAD binding domain-containing protein [Mycena sanguinolenta]